jgi:hypothetical protein
VDTGNVKPAAWLMDSSYLATAAHALRKKAVTLEPGSNDQELEDIERPRWVPGYLLTVEGFSSSSCQPAVRPAVSQRGAR